MKADDWDHWGFKINSDLENYDIYTINSKNGSSTLRTSTSSVSGLSCGSMAQCKPDIQKSYVNSTNGELVIKFSNHDGVYYGYDINSDSWSQANTFSSNFLDSDFIKRELVTGDNLGNVSFQAGGENIISKKSDGSVHIGKNSAVFKEENGREKFWAQDANGKSIPTDITNGSKLLINGRDVEQSINKETGFYLIPKSALRQCILYLVRF